MLEEIDPTTIEDAATRALVITLLNLLENALQQVQALKEENQRLRDEINRLKGEQGKPEVQPNTPATNYSSAAYTRPPKKSRLKDDKDDKGKKAKLSITRTEKLTLDRHLL